MRAKSVSIQRKPKISQEVRDRVNRVLPNLPGDLEGQFQGAGCRLARDPGRVMLLDTVNKIAQFQFERFFLGDGHRFADVTVGVIGDGPHLEGERGAGRVAVGAARAEAAVVAGAAGMRVGVQVAPALRLRRVVAIRNRTDRDC